MPNSRKAPKQAPEREPAPAWLRRDLERFEALKRAIAEVGLFRRGSLVQNSWRCGKKGCRCKADPPQLHGPYWHWTWKERGKTTGRYVRAEEKALFQEWMENRQRLDELLAEMQEVAHRATEKILRRRS